MASFLAWERSRKLREFRRNSHHSVCVCVCVRACVCAWWRGRDTEVGLFEQKNCNTPPLLRDCVVCTKKRKSYDDV